MLNPSPKNTITAIAVFTRSIVSSNSRYDQYFEGSLSLTSQEEQGMDYFFSDQLKCSECHGGYFLMNHQQRRRNISKTWLFQYWFANIDGNGTLSR